jgi:hypothetical protein
MMRRETPAINAEDLAKLEPGRPYQAVVIAIEGGGALCEADNGETIWMPVARGVQLGSTCVLRRGTG